MTENKINKTKMWKKLTAYASVAAVLAFAVLGGVYYTNNYVPSTEISIDVNPSVEIRLAKSERVIGVVAHNADGERILDGMDFEGADLDVTVNALIGSMLRHGYLNELANSVLVSVQGDSERSAELATYISDKIDALLGEESFGGAVLSQTVAKDSENEKLAEQYGITLGKAQLINDIIAISPAYTFAELAELSINELNILAEKTGTELFHHIHSTGEASKDSYIGYDAAKEAAYAHAGITASDATNIEAELDYEHGRMVYELEFDANGYEYEYDINAVTGEVIKSHKEKDDDAPMTGGNQSANPPATDDTTPPATNDTTPPATEYITRDEALAKAYAHAGVNAADVTGLKVRLDTDDGKTEYEIEFDALGYEYDYEINAVTGNITDSDKEKDDDYKADTKPNDNPPSEDTTPAGTTYIGRDKALEIAYNHAGVNASNAREVECELDKDDGAHIYEIEFTVGSVEYEYDINAVTGTILSAEKECDDDHHHDKNCR